ncbi:alginate export family protein [Novipirellula artificiosorum]|uniref:Alginate export domain-containing protein n=1 Tax=Novipirellula artificiosorum TaxID=2528016 RepID=A0A5C6DL99_9BACT|nr:alginate export family protein [Novipirellula artificiosorum]TWU37382.1 hypothetical protein Poly41_35120 [Novipirellula artificiosorum]
MQSSTPRRLRLALALIAMPVVASMISASAARAEEVITLEDLRSIVIQTTALQEPVVENAELTTPYAETPYIDSASSVESYAAVPTCNDCETTCCTQKQKEAATAAMKSAFGGVFYANNFSYLNDPCYDGPAFCGDCLKDNKTPFGTLSFGGETRFRYHNERNLRGLGITGKDDNFWLSRQRLYADWKINDVFRVYGEVLDAQSMGEDYAPRPIEENDMDILNLFVDVVLIDSGSSKLTARVGRQELLYGAQRTVSPLDWANTRRTFEGVRMLYQTGDTSIDAFWTEFVPVSPTRADESDAARQFYGVYASEKNLPVGTMDAYYLGYDNKTVGFSLHTIGSRILGETDRGWLYDVEGAFQFGSDATPSNHEAGFFTAGLGRKYETNLLSPTVWAYYDYASGEEDFAEVGAGDGGYEHLFPLAHKYNGFMDLFGRRNLHDFNVLANTPLTKKISLVLWYHYFRLDEQTTPYSVVMTPYNKTTQAESKDLGHEIDVLFNINLNPRNNVLLGYSHFAGGDYYDTPGIKPTLAGDDADADFFYAQFQTRY